MDYFKLAVLLLIVVRVQGFNNNSSKSVKEFKQNSIYYGINSSSHQWKYNQKKQFEDSFKHYRSDQIKTRQSRFISFNSKDDNIDVELDFAIPFLSVPVKRTLDTGIGFLSGIIRGVPMAELNFSSLLYTGMVIVLGATIGGISRVVSGGNFIEVLANNFGGPRSRNQRKRENGDEQGSQMWYVMDQIDQALQKFDIDSTACSQRILCWHVKDSLANVSDKKATNFDFILNGLVNSDWALQMISNEAWSDAITTGRNGENCETKYSQCNLSPNNLENFSKKLMQYTNLKK